MVINGDFFSSLINPYSSDWENNQELATLWVFWIIKELNVLIGTCTCSFHPYWNLYLVYFIFTFCSCSTISTSCYYFVVKWYYNINFTPLSVIDFLQNDVICRMQQMNFNCFPGYDKDICKFILNNFFNYTSVYYFFVKLWHLLNKLLLFYLYKCSLGAWKIFRFILPMANSHWNFFLTYLISLTFILKFFWCYLDLCIVNSIKHENAEF